MLGAPEETVEDLQTTFDLFREVRPYSYRLYITTPFPGNFLHDYAKEKGILNIQSYEEYDNAHNMIHGKLPMKLKYLTLGDILRYKRKLKRTYLRVNVARCLTHWSDMKLALKHVHIAINLLLDRL